MEQPGGAVDDKIKYPQYISDTAKQQKEKRNRQSVLSTQINEDYQEQQQQPKDPAPPAKVKISKLNLIKVHQSGVSRNPNSGTKQSFSHRQNQLFSLKDESGRVNLRNSMIFKQSLQSQQQKCETQRKSSGRQTARQKLVMRSFDQPLLGLQRRSTQVKAEKKTT